VEGLSYEVFDPRCNDCIKDIFVAGWSRQASTGLVGIARRDGTNGAKALLQYLQTLPPQSPLPLESVRQHLAKIAKPLITQVDLVRLSECETQEAQTRGVPEYKFDSNAEMLKVMGKN
jgi:ferredoxin--NADP+ reductase